MTSNNKQNQGEGRGWHGDPEGHAEAGRQSHKNDASKSSNSNKGQSGSSGGNR